MSIQNYIKKSVQSNHKQFAEQTLLSYFHLLKVLEHELHEDFNNDVLLEEIHDEKNLEMSEPIEVRNLEHALDLTEEELIGRFDNRKNLFDSECGTEFGDNLVERKDINFTISSLTNVFFDDKYKIIMCAVPKAATSNWQRVLVMG